MRREAAGLLVVVLALAGTSVAADRLITGAQIADRSLTGADVRPRSLRPRDFGVSLRGRPGPPGPQGPTGPQSPSSGPPGGGRYLTRDLMVSAAGSAIGGTQSHAFVGHPAPGVYCVDAGGYFFVQATSMEPDRPMIVAVDSYPGRPAEPPCARSPTRVSVFDPDGTPADGAFSLVFS